MITMSNETLNLIITVADTTKYLSLIEELINDERIMSVTTSNNVILKSSETSEETENEESKSTIRSDAISLLLRKLCLIPNHCGFHYILSAIKIAVAETNTTICITKDIYPAVARKFNSTPARVERCMRKSIDYAWKSNGREYFELAAGFNMNKRPTNSQFLSIVTEYIKTHKYEFY